MRYKETATITPNMDGTYKFDNGRNAVMAANADDAGALLEQQLWPLLEPALKAKKPITITIQSV